MIKNIGVVVVMMAVCGCGPKSGRDGNPGKADLSVAQGPPPSGDMSNLSSVDLSAQCGIQHFTLQKGLPPEVMIVLDRSASMTTSFDNGTRWSSVTSAVNQVVSMLQTQIGWGLTVFPTDSDCGTSASVDVGIASMNAAAISAKIASYTPDGNTPTGDAITKAAAYMAARTTPNPKYLLLSTDGEPNCGTIGTTCECLVGTLNTTTMQCCSGAVCFGGCFTVPTDSGASDAENALKAAAGNGINTFVIGVASDSSDSDELDTMATDGNEARATSPKYYAVGSAADLVSAVNTIASQIISCSFPLSAAPPAAQYITVSIDGTQIAQDTTHANGWDLSTNGMSLVLFGQACSMLQSDPNPNVQAVFGCPPVN
jgi:hypothetical protein